MNIPSKCLNFHSKLKGKRSHSNKSHQIWEKKDTNFSLKNKIVEIQVMERNPIQFSYWRRLSQRDYFLFFEIWYFLKADFISTQCDDVERRFNDSEWSGLKTSFFIIFRE